METERGFAVRRQGGVVAAGGFQQDECPDNVGLDEIGRPVDRAVDMTFRRQVHHRIRIVRREHLAHGGGVGDVGFDQDMAVVSGCLLQRVFRRGVSHLVDIDHHVIGLTKQVAYHGGTDEPATAG